jgi:uncharacterized membrane protein
MSVEAHTGPDPLRFHREHEHLSGAFGGDSFGKKAEAFACFFGTPRFILIQSGEVVFWIVINATGLVDFDLYPFILLNLAFSTQAAYAAPLILLAQNRQADRDKAEVERDRETNARALAETEYLAREIAAIRIALGVVVTRDYLRSELSRLEPPRERDG